MIKDYWTGEDLIVRVERADGKVFELFSIIDEGMIIEFEKIGHEDGIGNVDSFDVHFWDGSTGWRTSIIEL